MDIGGPKRAYTIEPVKDPVPRLETKDAKREEEPKAPAVTRPAKT